MLMHPYVNFNGQCEAAFTCYAQCLGGELGGLFRYAGTALADQVPPDWGNKVMHGSITIGGQLLQGADVAPAAYEEPKGFSLSLQIKDVAEAERIFPLLSQGGTVVMPLEKTFWAERFGVVIDQFGIRWIINCEGE